MDHRNAFDKMIKLFSLEAKGLAKSAGVSEVSLSRFRNGLTDTPSSSLIALLKAAPAPARRWYVKTVFLGDEDNIQITNWRSLIESASSEDIEEILRLLAERWASIQNSNSTDKIKDSSLV